MILLADITPPKLSCPQSYVIELEHQQMSYTVNFNETRKNVNATDASGPVKITFVPDRAVIPIGGFENVTVYASDSSGNRAQCHYQVSVQATPCVDWELKSPAFGQLNCRLPSEKGLQCLATCNQNYSFTDGSTKKTFSCDKKWTPTSIVPDCVAKSKISEVELGMTFYLPNVFQIPNKRTITSLPRYSTEQME